GDRVAREPLRRHIAECARLHHEPGRSHLFDPGRMAGTDAERGSAGVRCLRRNPVWCERRPASCRHDHRPNPRRRRAMIAHRPMSFTMARRSAHLAGFTLVELMVALAIATVLLLALAAMF